MEADRQRTEIPAAVDALLGAVLAVGHMLLFSILAVQAEAKVGGTVRDISGEVIGVGEPGWPWWQLCAVALLTVLLWVLASRRARIGKPAFALTAGAVLLVLWVVAAVLYTPSALNTSGPYHWHEGWIDVVARSPLPLAVALILWAMPWISRGSPSRYRRTRAVQD